MDAEEKYRKIFGDGDGNHTGAMPAGLALMIAASMPGMLGTQIITGDEVEFHDGGKISLPRGMTYKSAHRILNRLEEEAETQTRFNASFNYRPDDGAYAAAKVLRDRYGMALGMTVDLGFFGTMAPETRTIAISPTESVQVPWGFLEIPQLPGLELQLCDRHPDPEYGSIFELHVTAPKKYSDEVQAIFDAVEEQLKTGSIYRGKAVVGTNQLKFVDVSTFNADEIIFSDHVTSMLEGTVWSVLRYADTLASENIRLKRTILLHGEYGTGKSSAAVITAQIAVENGWTCIMAKPDDDIVDVLRTAKLYEPAVVIVEDVDTEAATGEDNEIKRLLDAFDGITAKGGKLVVVMTTNHLSRIHKGMLRPGRFDAVLEIGSLDRSGVERLIRVIVPEGKLAANVDFDEVYAAMEGFYPAFVREVLERAKTFAVGRLKGATNYTLSTDDLVKAAQSLQSQLAALNAANEGERMPTIDAVLGQKITDAARVAVHGTKVEFDHEHGGEVLAVPALNGNGN